jgi:hypothetical protein
MATDGVYAMQACCAVSLVAASAIMFTILRVQLFHKLFVKIIFFISLSDFFSSLALLFGGARTESAECYLQGITSNYFVLASFCWSAVICLQVHSVVIYGKVQNYMNVFYLFCWGFPLVVTLLPISTSTYGNDEGTPGWCFVANGHNNPTWTLVLWFLLGFYLWIWILIAYMSYVLFVVWYKFYVQQKGINPQAPVVVRRILGYPTIVVFCWTLPSILDIGDAFGVRFADGVQTLTILSYILPNIQGLLTGLVFFAANRDLVILLSPAAKDEDMILSQEPAKRAQRQSQRRQQQLQIESEIQLSNNFSEVSQYGMEFNSSADPYARSFFERPSYEVAKESFSTVAINNPIHRDVERGAEEKTSSMIALEVEHSSLGSTPAPPSTPSLGTNSSKRSSTRRISEYELVDSLLSTDA